MASRESLAFAQEMESGAASTLAWLDSQVRNFPNVPRVMVTSARWGLAVRMARTDAARERETSWRVL